MDQIEYNTHLEYRKQLVELAQNQINLYDKTIIAIATGSFGLSVLFFDKITTHNMNVSVENLYLSWTFLLTTVVLNLLSYLLSWYFCTKKIRAIDKIIQEIDIEESQKLLSEGSWVMYVNILSLGTLIIGLVLMISYAVSGLDGVMNVTQANNT